MRQKTPSKLTAAAVALVALSACGAPQLISDWQAAPMVDEATVDAFALAYLDSIQAQSIAESREFCGYFILLDGEVAAEPSAKGTEATCLFGPIPLRVLARYHTHGAYLQGYKNEIPSPSDLRISTLVPFNDYISTPGGRVWKLIGGTGIATQYCPPGCVTSDPNADPAEVDNVAKAYQLVDIATRPEG